MQSESKAALEKALKMLQTSERFESEVRRKLASYSPEIVDEVVEHLKAKRLLSDSRAAEQHVVTKSGRKAVGSRRLREELERRGADESTIATTVPTDDRGQLDALLRLKFKPTDNPARAGRFLYSRGFREDDIEAALDAYFGEAA